MLLAANPRDDPTSPTSRREPTVTASLTLLGVVALIGETDEVVLSCAILAHNCCVEPPRRLPSDALHAGIASSVPIDRHWLHTQPSHIVTLRTGPATSLDSAPGAPFEEAPAYTPTPGNALAGPRGAAAEQRFRARVQYRSTGTPAAALRCRSVLGQWQMRTERRHG